MLQLQFGFAQTTERIMRRIFNPSAGADKRARLAGVGVDF